MRLQTVFNATNEFFFCCAICSRTGVAFALLFVSRRCCAVGEAEKPSSVPGARIHCTQDGGKTWNQTFFQPGVNGGGNVTVRGMHGNPLWYARLLLVSVHHVCRPSTYLAHTLLCVVYAGGDVEPAVHHVRHGQ